ncbi:MAG: hypothetical protein FWG20_04575 [Candidatus Cloacimonetes bacterium]|nr:hypothetical protein [Candidatus Cloacimonadota bacterium]
MAIVSYTTEEIRKLADQTNWEKLRKMSDDDIDYSDIPEITDEFLKNAIICKDGIPIKSEIKVKLDKEIVDYYLSLGTNWQEKLNDTLLCVLKLRNIL